MTTGGPVPEPGRERPARPVRARSTRRAHPFRMPLLSPTFAEPGDFLALQRIAGNRSVVAAVQRPLSVQRSNPADTRLPKDQAEALAYAAADQAGLTAALARLATAADLARKNVPAAVRQWGLVVEPLTPRHDSPVGFSMINFFAGSAGYGTSVARPPSVDHDLDTTAGKVRVRARQPANVDNVLAAGQVEDRVYSAVSVAAHTRGGPPESFYEQYRAEFNAKWDVAPYTASSTEFDPALDSRGPRNQRARTIFEKVLLDRPLLSLAYSMNVGGARDQINRYSAPEGWNRLNSANIANLRAVFTAFGAPVSGFAYPAFLATVRTVSASLTPDEQRAIASSNDWERTISESVLTEAQRQEVKAAIATSAPVAPGPPVPPVPPPAAPVAPPGGGAAGAKRRFVDGIAIDAPAGPVLANAREEPITLTPKSTLANPGVTADTSFTVTPAARVRGTNTSPAAAWPAGSQTGTAFTAPVTNTATVAMTAHLDVTGLPAGLARRAPVPDAHIVVQDNRQPNFVASWSPAVSFNDGARKAPFFPGSPVRYRGGSQTFSVGAVLPGGQTNPGLTVFVKTWITRGGVAIVPPPPIVQFPVDQARIPQFDLQVSAPAVVPVAGDPLSVEVQLLAADRSTVLNTHSVAIPVLPEATYTQAAAMTAAMADHIHLHDNSPAGLLGQMTARGGTAANAAAAINSGQLTLRPLTVRHDSAAYVAATTGAPNPALVGYFYGTFYLPPGMSDPNSSANVAGAAGFTLGAGSGQIVMNRTTDVSTNAKRSDNELITLIVHEGVHAMDLPHSGTPIESYRTEFRAYWMDGRYGPPDRAVCTPADGPGCKDATFDPTMTPPGPKSPRARAIFDTLYGSVTYPTIKPAYDNNANGFRDEVDNTLAPDGINLILSGSLAELRRIIETSFSLLLRTRVQSFMGIGAPPAAPGAVLNAREREQVSGNRAWRDLVVNNVSGTLRGQILADLGIRT